MKVDKVEETHTHKN